MSAPFARQRYLIDYTLAALGRRRGKNVGLVVIYTAVVFVLASAMLFASAIRYEATTVLADSPELIVQELVMGRHGMLPAAHLEKLAEIRGVQGVEGRLWGYFYDRANGANYTLMVPGKDAAEYSVGPGEAIIGEGLARTRGFKEGGALLLVSQTGKLLKARIKSVLSSDSALVSADLALISEPDYRRFFELPDDVYTDAAVSIRNPREIEKIVEKATYALPSARFVTRSDIARTYESLFDWREGLLIALAAAAILAFAIFAAEKSSGLSAEEAREIGILKAIGWDTGDIIAMKLWEGGLVSLAAFLIGTVLAYIHVYLFDAGLFEPVLKGWSVLYPDFSLAPRVDGLQLATLFVLTVVPYTAATLVPIWRTAITDPDEVMR